MTTVRRAGWGDGALYEDFHDAQVRVVSDRPLPREQAKALATRVERAWQADLEKHQWNDERPLHKQLTVAVLSRDAFERFTGDETGSIAGVTTGPDVFVMPERVLRGVSVDDQDTIAHELAHVQDFRMAGDAMAQVPTWLEEGKASVIGDAFGRSSRHLHDAARTMAGFSADDVAYLLQNFRGPDAENQPPNFVYAGEVMGALFVEYLGAHVKRDAVLRISDAIEAAGNGVEFGAAFRAALGLSLGEAQRRFVEFIRETEGDPNRRLAGTLYGR
jgi:hypothetical protein